MPEAEHPLKPSPAKPMPDDDPVATTTAEPHASPPAANTHPQRHRPAALGHGWLGTWWPGTHTGAKRPILLGAVLIAVMWAVSIVNLDGNGIGLSIAGIATVALPLYYAERTQSLSRLIGTTLVCALWIIATIRDADWIVWVCGLAAVALSAMIVTLPRRLTAVFLAVLAPMLGIVGAAMWVARGSRWLFGRDSGTGARNMRILAVTSLLLVVFGGLFAAADAAFASMLSALLPHWRFDVVVGRMMVAGIAFTVVCLACYLAVTRPRFDAADVPVATPVSRAEWTIPLTVLNALFAAFITVQAGAFFGGAEYVELTAGLTYADYARSGFWQLSVVTVLTLVVIGVAAWKAPRTTGMDRLIMRMLLGALCIMSLVVVASALHRMNLYSQTFGLTRLRVWVFAIEIWFALVFCLVLACGLRLRAGWLPRAVVASGAAMLVGLALANPDALIAEHNVDLAATEGRFDPYYLAGLSADAAPAVMELPQPDRDCVLDMTDWGDVGTAPLSWNLSRDRAAEMVPNDASGTCELGITSGP